MNDVSLVFQRARRALRLTTEVFDDEISDLIQAGIVDMRIAGIAKDKIIETDPAIVRTLLLYVKANFGTPDESSEKLLRSYNTLVNKLRMDGDYNV